MGEKNGASALAHAQGSVVQNFFIVLPSGGPAAGFTNPTQAEDVLQLIKTALGSVTASEQNQVPHRETFSDVGREWFLNNASVWSPSYALRLKNRLETGLLDELGGRPISGISPPDILDAVRKIEMRGARETARRILRIASAVFRYGIATGRCSRDPTSDLRGALKPARAARHRAALPGRDLPKFLKVLGSYQGTLTKCAIELVLLTFVRTRELRFARWAEFEDLEGSNPIWRVPAERMKMRRVHLVPLPQQAVGVLCEIRDLKLGSSYLFPANTKAGVISENTLLFALYRMDYRGRATVHGFRSLASTILNEAQFNRDWIEMQLAHADSSVRGIYNAAEWMPARRQMLQWWAGYLDGCRK